jgi:hypothetical protein
VTIPIYPLALASLHPASLSLERETAAIKITSPLVSIALLSPGDDAMTQFVNTQSCWRAHQVGLLDCCDHQTDTKDNCSTKRTCILLAAETESTVEDNRSTSWQIVEDATSIIPRAKNTSAI